MTEPWFDPNVFGPWYGGLGGAIGGTLGGILGAVIGILAPKGKGRKWVLAAMWLFLLFGLVNLGLGLFALAVGQPYGIWYPLVLLGVIFTLVIGPLLPVVYRRYQQAEQRRLEAEGFRSQ